jgi:hypothetical protein
MNSELADKLDSHFFRVMKGSVTEPLKYISDVFDVSEGLKAEELLIGKNIGSLEYLFTVSALAFSEGSSAPVVHPVISVPSVETNIVCNFLKSRFETYATQDPKIKFFPINAADLVGQAVVQFDNSESIKVPSLVKWRIENEEKARHTALFFINNVKAITQNETITLKEILSELSSVSSEASFIIFLKPSAFNFVRATLDDDEFQSKFSRSIFFDGFEISDVQAFKRIIESRLKSNERTQDISLEDLDLNQTLTISRGIPFYAFKIVEEDLKNIVIKTSGDTSNAQTLSSMKNTITNLWKNIDSLTSGQIDILTAFAAFPQEKANIYEVQDKMKQFRKSVGNRTAVLQQIRKLYENELLDRERPVGSREVYYQIKPTALPAIEFRIKESLTGGK